MNVPRRQVSLSKGCLAASTTILAAQYVSKAYMPHLVSIPSRSLTLTKVKVAVLLSAAIRAVSDSLRQVSTPSLCTAPPLGGQGEMKPPAKERFVTSHAGLAVSPYQLAEVVAAHFHHLPLVPHTCHIVFHVHFHAGEWWGGDGQSHWVTVYESVLDFRSFYLSYGE